MAAEPAAAEAKDVQAPAASAKKRFGGRRVKIAAIVLAVMAVQAVAAALLLPKGHTAASGHAAETAAHGDESHGEKTEKSDDLIEVEIDKFSCSIELDDGIIW